jgi:hypothetical protein
MYKLFLFVEGPDDLRFFKTIFLPKFKKKYQRIKFVKYAEMKPVIRERMINAIEGSGADYLYVQDLDDCVCVRASKQETIDMLNNAISSKNIVVVIRTIECWYLCLMNGEYCQKIFGNEIDNTEEFNKTKFDNLIPKETPRVDFLTEILLHRYSITEGKVKNRSFKYFVEKWIEPLSD